MKVNRNSWHCKLYRWLDRECLLEMPESKCMYILGLVLMFVFLPVFLILCALSLVEYLRDWVNDRCGPVEYVGGDDE